MSLKEAQFSATEEQKRCVTLGKVQSSLIYLETDKHMLLVR